MSRSRLQGLRNVVVFNWPYYAFAIALCVGLVLIASRVSGPWTSVLHGAAILVTLPVLTSILASLWVHDLSGLYELRWLDPVETSDVRSLLVLNAGFDEISGELRGKLPTAELRVIDFHDPKTTTEASIERARRAGGQKGDVQIAPAGELPIDDRSTDLAIAFMSAHEIRAPDLRIAFFRELVRGLAPGGRIVVVEHLRDLANFIAYSLGVRHFLSRADWERSFAGAGLTIRRESAHTPLVRIFVLVPEGEAA